MICVAHVSLAISVLYRSCTTHDNRGLGSADDLDHDLSDVTVSGVEEIRIPPYGYVAGTCAVHSTYHRQGCELAEYIPSGNPREG